MSEEEGKTELADADAVLTATNFVKLFYEMMDKRRHAALKLYLDTAKLVWNGNDVTGNSAIRKFLEEIPATEHTIQSVDAQALPDVAVGAQTTVLVSAGGLVRLSDQTRPFSQHFLLTAQEGKWKVVTDTFRFVELVA